MLCKFCSIDFKGCSPFDCQNLSFHKLLETRLGKDIYNDLEKIRDGRLPQLQNGSRASINDNGEALGAPSNSSSSSYAPNNSYTESSFNNNTNMPPPRCQMPCGRKMAPVGGASKYFEIRPERACVWLPNYAVHSSVEHGYHPPMLHMCAEGVWLPYFAVHGTVEYDCVHCGPIPTGYHPPMPNVCGYLSTLQPTICCQQPSRIHVKSASSYILIPQTIPLMYQGAVGYFHKTTYPNFFASSLHQRTFPDYYRQCFSTPCCVRSTNVIQNGIEKCTHPPSTPADLKIEFENLVPWRSPQGFWSNIRTRFDQQLNQVAQQSSDSSESSTTSYDSGIITGISENSTSTVTFRHSSQDLPPAEDIPHLFGMRPVLNPRIRYPEVPSDQYVTERFDEIDFDAIEAELYDLLDEDSLTYDEFLKDFERTQLLSSSGIGETFSPRDNSNGFTGNIRHITQMDRPAYLDLGGWTTLLAFTKDDYAKAELDIKSHWMDILFDEKLQKKSLNHCMSPCHQLINNKDPDLYFCTSCKQTKSHFEFKVDKEESPNSKPFEFYIEQMQEAILKQPIANFDMNVSKRKSGKALTCSFCKTNSENREFYESHTLKDENGRVTCPVLRMLECPYCYASGDIAHTKKYCPFYITLHEKLPAVRRLANGALASATNHK